jgi:hypothetical protein
VANFNKSRATRDARAINKSPKNNEHDLKAASSLSLEHGSVANPNDGAARMLLTEFTACDLHFEAREARITRVASNGVRWVGQ